MKRKHYAFAQRIGSLILTLSLLSGIIWIPTQALRATAEEAPHDLYYNFIKSNTKAARNEETSATFLQEKVTSYDVNTYGKSGQHSIYIYSDPWKYNSANYTEGKPGYMRYLSPAYGIAMYNGGAEATFQLDIQIPVSGYYQAEVIASYKDNAGVINLSLEKDGAETIELGSIDTYAKQAQWNLSIPLKGAHYLEAGEYTFVVESVTPGRACFIDALRLNVVSPGVVPAPILIGQECEIPLYSAGGNVVQVASESINVAAEDSSVLEIVGVDKENGSVKVRGIATGKSDLSVTTTGEIPLSYDLPVRVIAANQGAETLRYDFKKMNSYAAGKNDAAIPFINTYNQTANGAPGEVNPDASSAPWKFYGWSMLGVNLANDSLGNGYLRCLGGAHGVCLYQAGRLQLRIRVPVGGTFDFKAVVGASSPIPIQVLIYPYDEQTRLAGSAVYNHTMQITSGGYTEETLSGGEIELSAGEYLVDIVQQTRGEVLSLRSIILESVKNSLNVSVPGIIHTIAGETQKSALAVTDYENLPVPAEKLTAKLSVDDEAIADAEIITENNTLMLHVTGKKKGETTIIIDLIDDLERGARVKIPIQVASDTELRMTVNLPDKIEKGETLRIPIQTEAVCKGESTGVAASISVKHSLDGLLSANVELGTQAGDAMLVLHGEKTGNLALTVTATSEGESVHKKQAIMVYDTAVQSTKQYRYMIQKKLPEGVLLSSVDDYLKMIPSSGEEMRPGTESATWRYAGQGAPDSVKEPSWKYYYDTYGSALEMGEGIWGAIQIRVPESGIYDVISHNALYCMAGIMRVYLAPADAENPRAAQYAVGTKDMILPGKDNSQITLNQETRLQTMPITAGDYIVTWEIIGKNSECTAADPRLYIGGVILKAVNALPEMTLTSGTVPTVKVDNVCETELTATLEDGTKEELYGWDFTVTADQEGLCEAHVIHREGKSYLMIEGKRTGATTLHLSASFAGVTRANCDVPVTITDRGILTKVELALAGNNTNTIALRTLDADSNIRETTIRFFDEDNLEISAEKAAAYGATIQYRSMNEQIAIIGSDGTIAAVSGGTVIIQAAVTMNGATVIGEMKLHVTNGKAASSYYTAEKVSAARENAQNYSWARSIRDAAVSKAEYFIGKEDTLWNLITTQELPRSYHVGYRSDAEVAYCRYCGINIVQKYGNAYPWLYTTMETPWKIQCPDCRRFFPSNDFGSFYQLGLDENGNFRYEQAKEKNAELIAAGKDGYLKNILYPEKGEGWGVDDGYGYVTGRTYADGTPEVHTYISYYNHWAIWHANGTVNTALGALRDAYLYTGEHKYGRVGAILLDRVADVYPDMDTNPYRWQLQSIAAVQIPDYLPQGKTVDLIWENQNAENYAKCYDAFFPAYEDSYVVNFLSQKAAKYHMDNAKTNTASIRENCEDGILREIFRSAKNGKLNGNFGMTQSALAYAAVVLDSMPETRDMLDWNFRAGINVYQGNNITGGNILPKMITEVNRDGISATEVAPEYSNIWIGGLSDVVDALAGYEGYPAMDFYRNPKYMKMLASLLPLTLGRRQTAAIGDSAGVADTTRNLRPALYLKAFQQTQDPLMAQILYFYYNGEVSDLHYDIFTKNPNSVGADIRKVIEDHGEYNFDQSNQLGGYGFTILRGGTTRKITGNLDPINTQRDFWMFYGNNASHAHYDGLNLGMRAYGIDMAPELGYPIDTTSDNYYNWGQGTIAHNTVLVNDQRQTYIKPRVDAPIHYDGDGRVKLMDVDAPTRYGTTSIYRRSVVMVDVDDDVSYGVDFFRVKGGNEHLYSFHSLSDEVFATENLQFTKQANQDGAYVGSYAGPTVNYGTTGMSNGFSWLKNVNRDQTMEEKNISIDFQIKDFRKQFQESRDLHLRMTI